MHAKPIEFDLEHLRTRVSRKKRWHKPAEPLRQDVWVTYSVDIAERWEAGTEARKETADEHLDAERRPSKGPLATTSAGRKPFLAVLDSYEAQLV